MRWTVLFALACVWPSAVRAAIDPETKTPYRLRVVLRIAEHPHFTEHFRRELKRDLQGSLQAALGNLGTVEIVDLQSIKKENRTSLWKLADEKGLAALDTFNELGDCKTHFVFLDFKDDRYQIQARQHDGSSGFVTPIIRTASTHVHGFVSRLAAMMIGQDFGLVGTYDPAGAGDRIFIKVCGGERAPFDRWVAKGDVFAVVAIKAQRPPLAAATSGKTAMAKRIVQVGERVDGMLLLVADEPRDGTIPCRMVYRFPKFQSKGALGFRCIKLGGCEAPLRLKLVDRGGALPKARLQVYAGADQFPETNRESEELTLQDGVFVSRQRFRNVAFARVVLTNSVLARIPVEILDDRVEVRVINLDPAAEQRDRLAGDRKNLIERIRDCRLIQNGCFKDITELERAGNKDGALKRVGAALKQIDAEAAEIQHDIERLKAQAVDAKFKTEAYTIDCEAQLQKLREKQDELRQHSTALAASIAQDNDPATVRKKKMVQDLVNTAKLLESQAEYDQALAKYEEALAEVKDEPAVKQQIEASYQKLKKAWSIEPGDPALVEARRFIRETWPKLSTAADVRDHLAAARKAFEACKAAQDRLAVNKMLLGSVEVAAKFADELKKLGQTAETTMEEEDKKTLEAYQKVNEDLIKLLKDVQAYVDGAGM